MRGALFKRLQRRKDGAGIGAIRPCRAEEASNAHRIAHAWDLQTISEARRITASVRSKEAPYWQLDVDDQIAFVLRRDEAHRHGGEPQIGQADQTAIEHEDDDAEPEHQRHQASIAVDQCARRTS